ARSNAVRTVRLRATAGRAAMEWKRAAPPTPSAALVAVVTGGRVAPRQGPLQQRGRLLYRRAGGLHWRREQDLPLPAAGTVMLEQPGVLRYGRLRQWAVQDRRMPR